MAYLHLGTGLAEGLELGGRLWRGARGVAGEIGHIPVDAAGPHCPCGQPGCLELAAAGSGLGRSWPGGDSVRDLFSAAILEQGPVAYPLEDTVANMRVIEAVFRSEQTGGWVTI